MSFPWLWLYSRFIFLQLSVLTKNDVLLLTQNKRKILKVGWPLWVQRLIYSWNNIGIVTVQLFCKFFWGWGTWYCTICDLPKSIYILPRYKKSHTHTSTFLVLYCFNSSWLQFELIIMGVSDTCCHSTAKDAILNSEY